MTPEARRLREHEDNAERHINDAAIALRAAGICAGDAGNRQLLAIVDAARAVLRLRKDPL